LSSNERPRNLQRELEEIIKKTEASGIRPKLLLHICCAPCSSYCLEYLDKYFDITVYFANSNIDDPQEYVKRREEERRLLAQMPLSRPVAMLEGPYDPDGYHQLVRGHELDPEGGERCGICFTMRLEQAARAAAQMGADYFTTSLSISPLKNAARLCAIGESAGEKYGVAYLPSDFKKKDGYKRSIELSREYGLYRQNYCGCSYSLAESLKRRQTSE
jgi:epoxyqueuosine reductase